MNSTAHASDLFFKGLDALGKGELARAEDHFRAALALAPGRPSIMVNLSIVQTRMGRLEEALALAEAALAAEPRNPLFLMQAGAVQLRRGLTQEALSSFEAALAANATFAEAHNGRGNALLALQRTEEAIGSFDAAIRLKPDYAEAFSNRGSALRLLGRREDALASYRQAIALRPAHAGAHNNMGNLLRDMGRTAEALACYDKAIGLQADYTEAHVNRGHVLADLNRLDEAEESYRHAGELAGDRPDGWLGVARLKSQTGQFADALALYEKARLLSPDAAEPLCGIAENRRFSAGDPLIADYRRLLGSGRLAGEDLSRLHHAYAKICNDIGDYDEAMTQFGLGKRMVDFGFDAAAQERTYDSLTETFDRAFFAARAGFGVTDERPVFIVGMPRSGTTLAEQILASHPDVEGLGELPDLPRLVKQLGGDPFDAAQFGAAVRRLDKAGSNRLAARYLEAYDLAQPRRLRLIDKQPHNYEWLGLIALMFPKARIIHCRRDPLDTCVSIYMQKFNARHGYNQDLATLGRYYREYERLMAHWKDVLPLPMHDCSYERVTEDLEGSARALVAFLGLAWDPACMDFHLQDRRVDTPSRWQVRQPLYQGSVGRWRRYERHLGPLRQALGAP